MTVRFVIDDPASPRDVRVRLRALDDGWVYAEAEARPGVWYPWAALNPGGFVNTAWAIVSGGTSNAGRLAPAIFPAFAAPDPAPEPQDAAPKPFRVGDRVRFKVGHESDLSGREGVVVACDPGLALPLTVAVVEPNGDVAGYHCNANRLTHADAAP